GNIDGLFFSAYQERTGGTIERNVNRVVQESIKIEIAAEFAVYPPQQIQIESGSDAGRVVICKKYHTRVFLQVETDEKTDVSIKRPQKPKKEDECRTAMDITDYEIKKDQNLTEKTLILQRKQDTEIIDGVACDVKSDKYGVNFVAKRIVRLIRNIER